MQTTDAAAISTRESSLGNSQNWKFGLFEAVRGHNSDWRDNLKFLLLATSRGPKAIALV